MKKKAVYILAVLGLICAGACKEESTELPTTPREGRFGGGWSVPDTLIFSDGLPPESMAGLDEPEFLGGWNEALYLQPQDMVIAYYPGDSTPVKIYPHKILDWHMVVNDRSGAGASWAVTYSPLTGSAWVVDLVDLGGPGLDRTGLIYCNNSLFIDRATGSEWAQLLFRAVRGPLEGEQALPRPCFETDVLTARKMFPGAKVMDWHTGQNVDYSSYPYDDYRDADYVMFPLPGPTSGKLNNKDRVLGVVLEGEAVAYRIDPTIKNPMVINDVVGGVPVTVMRSPRDNLITCRIGIAGDLGPLAFTIDESRTDVYPFNIRDSRTGTSWDFLGRGVEGPLAGEQLPAPPAAIAFWFAWEAFYPDTRLYYD